MYNNAMRLDRMVNTEVRQAARWSLLLGGLTPLLSLMLGLLAETIFSTLGHNLPFLYAQDAHVTIPVCRHLPRLYGCAPGAGAWTGLQLWENARLVARLCALAINLPLTLLAAGWVALRLRRPDRWTGLLTGISALLASLILALMFAVSLDAGTWRGAFAILALASLPVSGWLGGLLGQQRLARRQSRLTVQFIPGEAATEQMEVERLSERELEVLALVAVGCRNQEIARRLYISPATVKTHLIHIYGKLGVNNRTAAVTRALALGWLHQAETGPQNE